MSISEIGWMGDPDVEAVPSTEAKNVFQRLPALAGAILLLLFSSANPYATEPSGPVRADEVAYATGVVNGPFSYRLECHSDAPVGNVLWARGVEFPDGWMPTSTYVLPRGSAEGVIVRLADHGVTFEERVETPPTPTTELTIVGVSGAPAGGRVHFAWATWEGVLNCLLRLDGIPLTPASLGGQHAMYVGPEAFTGGAFYQDGASQLSVARAFRADGFGGALLGRFFIADRIDRVATGAIVTDDPYPLEPIIGCEGSCDFGRPMVSEAIALMTVGASDQVASQQLWLIALPRPSM